MCRHVGPVSVDLYAGECAGLSGASGTGKTLLLRALADLDPHQGKVYLDGAEAQDCPPWEWRRQVGLLPAESHWWAEAVGDHFPRVEPDWLARLDLADDVLGYRITRLSTGERQRLALLRLLANGPSVLLLDEPTASLDGDNVRRAEELVNDYRIATGAAVLWVSHDRRQIARVAQCHYRLEAGRLEPQR